MAALITDLALILICAGVMTLIFKKLKQPLVLGYIVAGFLASPNMPYMPSVSDLEGVHLWSDIGVIFLLFALGLEFSFKKIMKMGSAPIIAAITIITSMMAVGFFTGKAFGWSQMDSIFLGGMLAMSSTTIIFKAFEDMGLRQQRFASLVLSVLIIEDILAIVLMVMLSTLAVSQQFQGIQMATSILKLVFFLVLWFVVGIYMIPLFLKKVKPLMSNETMLIVALGLCFGMVVLASSVGFSPAFGAFIMGSILAETVEAEHIEHLVAPVKDLFGAIFFVSVGMMVDVALIGHYIVPISLSVTSDFLYPIVVAVSVFTTFTTPYMIRLAEPAYNLVDRHVPKRWKRLLDHYAGGEPNVIGQENHWKAYLSQIAKIVLIFGVLSIAILTLMYQFAEPFFEGLLPAPWNDLCMAALTLLFVSPFVRALMMKKNHSQKFQMLWNRSRTS